MVGFDALVARRGPSLDLVVPIGIYICLLLLFATHDDDDDDDDPSFLLSGLL